MTLPFGIDISKYQFSSDGTQKPDFDKVNATCDFVAVRAGISWGYTDPWFAYSWEHITKPRLAYHVVYPGESAIRQMERFLRIVDPDEHDWLVLDAELDHGYSKARITQTLSDCIEHLFGATGRYPIIYSRALWINQFVDVADLPPLDWWLAHYLWRRPSPLFTPEKDPPPALPRGVNNWLIHQTGERGNGSAVGVASHYVDTNRWNGTQAELLAYFGLADGYEPLPPEPEPPEVQEPLFQARVVTIKPNRLRTRYTPEISSTNIRPEPDWYKSGRVVSVYETKPDWYRTAVETWASSEWMQRLDYQEPPTLIDIPPLWQQDPRWKTILLGYSKTMTIGGWGCLIVTLAMRLGITPEEVNDRLKAVGGFTGANVYWQMVQVAFPQLTDFEYIECYWTPAPLDRIDSRLAEGIPVHVHVDLYNETASMEQHWVLLVGKNDDDYVMNDPWTGKQGSFREVYGDPARWIFRIASWRKQ
jgi:GH25 family lysozyme M1 (1,4-beta-N-acetylmuramidase)